MLNRITLHYRGLRKRKGRKVQEIYLKNYGLKLSYSGERNIQVQEAQKVANKMNSKRHTTRHIIIKIVMLRIKRKSQK